MWGRLFAIVLMGLGVLCAQAQDSIPPIEPKVLVQEIAQRISRVPEFGEIRQMAEERGLRVWLFGGSAAAFAHYVKWDVLREQGALRAQSDRFDYDFTNVYRSTQDLDIVIDGDAKAVGEFQRALEARFPYFVGSKTQWEVRSLTQEFNGKMPLLENPDFLNQHTDSNSTGMIELTRKKGKPPVRDLRDWNSSEPQFLVDVAEGKLHYYFSDKHETTKRFIDGRNPPIISVVRYLTKAFQYELAIRPEDLEVIRMIIERFDPKESRRGYVLNWLERNGPKLFQNAVDIAYAWNVLEELGLRKKLIEVSIPREMWSLAWWMNKEPLRDSSDSRRLPTREETGKTAKDLGITLVTHETNGFLAYESIRRSHKGVPNALISRTDGIGETAALGNGFYTQLGNKGARATGFHIRFNVDPDAREGVDFFRDYGGRYIVWLTRDKLEVVPESLNFSPAAALEFIIDPKNEDEKGIIEMFKRKLDVTLANPKTVAEMEHIIDRMLKRARNDALVGEFIFGHEAFKSSPKWEKWGNILIKRRGLNWARRYLFPIGYEKRRIQEATLKKVLGGPLSARHPKWAYGVRKAIRIAEKDFNYNRFSESIAREVLSQPAAVVHPEWPSLMKSMIRMFDDGSTARYVLTTPAAIAHPSWEELVRENLQNDKYRYVQTYVLHVPEAVAHPAWPELMRKVGKSDGAQFYASILSSPSTWDHPEWMEFFEHFGKWFLGLKEPSQDHARGFVRNIMKVTKAHASPLWSQVLMRMIELNVFVRREIVDHNVLLNPRAMEHPDWTKLMRRLIELNGTVGYQENAKTIVETLIESKLGTESVLSHKRVVDVIEVILFHGQQDKKMVEQLLARPHATQFEQWGDWIDKLVERGDANYELARLVLGKDKAKADPRWNKWVGKVLTSLWPEPLKAIPDGIKKLYRSEEIRRHPKWADMVLALVEKNGMDFWATTEAVLEPDNPEHHLRWFELIERLVKSAIVPPSTIRSILLKSAQHHPRFKTWMHATSLAPQDRVSYLGSPDSSKLCELLLVSGN